jgi:hypothetical protein
MSIPPRETTTHSGEHAVLSALKEAIQSNIACEQIISLLDKAGGLINRGKIPALLVWRRVSSACAAWEK